MSNLKSVEDIYGRLLSNDEPYIAGIATGIIFKLLPETSWSNMQAFLGVAVIYIAAFSCVYLIKRRYKQYKRSKYITLERWAKEHVG